MFVGVVAGVWVSGGVWLWVCGGWCVGVCGCVWGCGRGCVSVCGHGCVGVCGCGYGRRCVGVWVCVGVGVCVVSGVRMCGCGGMCGHGCLGVCRRVCSAAGLITSEHQGCACLSWSSVNTTCRRCTFSDGRTSVHGLGREPRPVCGPAGSGHSIWRRARRVRPERQGNRRARLGMGLATFSSFLLSCDSCDVQNYEQQPSL